MSPRDASASKKKKIWTIDEPNEGHPNIWDGGHLIFSLRWPLEEKPTIIIFQIHSSNYKVSSVFLNTKEMRQLG